MAAGSILVGAGTASAALTVSQAQGRFLSGSVGATNLDNIVAIAPASATNDGTTPKNVNSHPLDVLALNAVNADLGSGLNLFGANGVITLGAANQYASASLDGSSYAASGAVDSNGAIAVGGSPGVPSSTATVDLTKVLGSSVGPGLTVLSAGTLTVGAVSATANESAAGAQTGTYKIASLKLDLTSPLVTGLTGSLNATNLTTLLGQLPLADATFGNVPNLSTLLANVGTVSSPNNSITVNLSTGAITIDVAAVLAAAGLDINNLPPNTEILPYVVTALTTSLLPSITSAVNSLVAQINTAVSGITATTTLGPVLPLVLGPLLATLATTITSPLTTALAGADTTVTGPLGDALSGLLSLTGNGRSTAAGKFTETALRLTLVPGATPAAVVRLASASVGVNTPLSRSTTTLLSPNHGPQNGGTSVVITGTGFIPGGTSVTIGGITVPAVNVTVNAGGTTATFTSPAHAVGQVGVTVTTGGGTSTPALQYTYESLKAQRLTPDHGPVTGGTVVTVTGSGFIAGSTSVTIGGIKLAPSAVTVTASNTLHFTTPAHPIGGVSVTVTAPNGTSMPPLGFYYGPLPVASCILTGGNAGTVTVTASVGTNTAGVASRFSVTRNGQPVGTPTPVTPLLGGFLVAQASVPLPDSTTSVGYTLTATNGSYPVVAGGPITCTPLTPTQREAGVYHPLQSARLLDTRLSVKVGAGATYTLQVLGRGGIPATKVASVVANLTVTRPLAGGFLTVYPGGSRPNVSSANFVADQTVANLLTAPVGTDGKIRIYNSSSRPTDVLVDVSGYFSSGDTVVPGSYNRLDPARILDTNEAVGVPTRAPVPAGGILTLKVTGVGGVASTNVSAVALNLTVAQTQAAGFITVFKSGTTPNISSLNFLRGQTDANLVIAPVAPDGTIKIRNASEGTVRLVADVSGYFLGGVPILDGEFVAVSPSRVLDTRITKQPVQRLATISPTMLGRNGVPATGVSAVVLNVTVDHTIGNGYITVFPHDPRPTASNLNFVAGQPRPNSVIGPVGSDGKLRMFNGSERPVDLIADVSGYFISKPLR